MVDFDKKGDESLFASTDRAIQRKQQELSDSDDIDIYTEARSLLKLDPDKQARTMEAIFKSNDKQQAGLVS